jgi:hypothetical protein
MNTFTQEDELRQLVVELNSPSAGFVGGILLAYAVPTGVRVSYTDATLETVLVTRIDCDLLGDSIVFMVQGVDNSGRSVMVTPTDCPPVHKREVDKFLNWMEQRQKLWTTVKGLSPKNLVDNARQAW